MIYVVVVAVAAIGWAASRVVIRNAGPLALRAGVVLAVAAALAAVLMPWLGILYLVLAVGIVLTITGWLQQRSRQPSRR